ncbi:MAG: S1/P1 nuclease [Pyrinomonadaceae bacterium]
MLNLVKRLGLSSGILCILILPAFGWDDTGHKISAYIAWQQMTPAVRERVIKIMTEAPEDSQLGALYATYGSQSQETRKRDFFMVASTWADMVRDRNFATRFRKYNKGNWHYADTFWSRSGDNKITYLPAPEDGGQALARLEEYNKLITSNAKDADKAIAIAWLLHIIGDLHQPLHTSARITETEPKGDQGGNLFLLTPQGTPRADQLNLHWYWDSIIVRNVPNGANACDSEYLAPIAQRIMKEYPYAKMESRIDADRFEAWVKDSLTYAQNDVFSSDLKRFEMPSEKYKKKAFGVARLRLAMAGYRMADMFNRAFTASPVS